MRMPTIQETKEDFAAFQEEAFLQDYEDGNYDRMFDRLNWLVENNMEPLAKQLVDHIDEHEHHNFVPKGL